MMRAVLDDMENYPVYFCMFQRRFFVLLCFFFALLLCVPAQGLSANPPDYERAKAQLERLHHGRHSASEWQACADAFRRAYDRNPKWHLRVAALYRQGVALEGRARVTRTNGDARRALSTYEHAVHTYPASALADDALFRAAVVCNELLRDQKRARSHLEQIKRRYSRSDHARPAADYYEKMLRVQKGQNKSPAAKKVTPPPQKAEVQNHKAAPPKAKAPEKKVLEKKAPPKKAAPAPKPPVKKAVPDKKAPDKKAPVKKAPAPKGKPIAHNLAAQLGLSVRTIVIDPGHGGRDPGTMHNGVVERDVNLDIAKRLNEILKKRGYTVKLTRDRNKWLALGERVRFGKKAQGDLFVSIHVNACDNPKVSGFETYILDFARTSSASRLAVIENANSGRLGDMDKVLTEILRGARTAESRRLADCIQSGTLAHLKRNKSAVKDGGVKGAPFFVLVGSSMPSVLVEVGYCSNKYEARRLKDHRYRQLVAQGIANGIHSYATGLSVH